MPFAAALSTAGDSSQAIEEVCQRVSASWEGKPDLVLSFFSLEHSENAEQIAKALHERLQPRCLLGCMGESIVGNDQEVEHQPALSLWLGRWNQAVQAEPFHLTLEQTPDGISLLGWPDGLAEAEPAQSALLLLGDPFTFPTDAFLDQVNSNHAGLRAMGGMASGAREPGQSRLILGDQVFSEGAVGVLLEGPVKIRSIVSQGCRPIGRHLVITKARENIIAELGGRPPLQHLQRLWPELNKKDQQLLQHGLHVGRVINEYQGEFQRGDFLVRNVLGLDQESGAMAITDFVRVGQTVQFHVRDAETADEDLHALLKMDLAAHERRPNAALLFTCNGRGTRLFSEPHHDARAIRQEAGDLPLAGFFAAGELGPVGGKNFIHGFTASVVLFEDQV
jgi:small ligand-binding sensory domain FIST